MPVCRLGAPSATRGVQATNTRPNTRSEPVAGIVGSFFRSLYMTILRCHPSERVVPAIRIMCQGRCAKDRASRESQRIPEAPAAAGTARAGLPEAGRARTPCRRVRPRRGGRRGRKKRRRARRRSRRFHLGGPGAVSHAAGVAIAREGPVAWQGPDGEAGKDPCQGRRLRTQTRQGPPAGRSRRGAREIHRVG